MLPTLLGAAETKTKPTLNPSERALYEVLRATPHYKYGEVFLNLTLNGQAEFGIGSELTPDSLDKLARYLPDLPAVVEAGKKFRIDHLNHIAVRGEVATFEGTGIDRNPSARLLRTYYQMVRAYNRKKEVAPTDKQVTPTAYEIVRSLHGHLPGSSTSDWPLEHQRQYQSQIEKLKEFTTRATPTRELPENIFKAWLSAELKRVRAQRQKIVDLGATVDPRRKSLGVERQAGEYQDSLLSWASDFRVDAQTVLESTDGQAKMVEKLERQQISADSRLRKLKAHFFGGNEDRRGGKFSPLHNPELGWVQDIFWWGLAEGGKRDPAEELSPYWAMRARSSRRLLGLFPLLRNSSIEKVADPDSYRERVRKLWQERQEKARRIIGKGAKAALIVGLAVGAEEGIRHYGWPAAKGVMAYLNQPSGGRSTSGSYGSDGAEAQSLTDAIAEQLSPLAALSNGKPNGPGGRGGKGGAIPGVADPHQPSSASPPGEGGDPEILFKITKSSLLGEESHIPLEFEFANADDRFEGQQVVDKPPGPAQFTIETAVPQKVDWTYASLLGADGFVPQVDVYLDGKQLAKTDYKLMHQPRSGTYFVQLPRHGTVAWRATYYKADGKTPQRRQVAPARLPDIPAYQAAWLNALQKDAGQIKQAEDLEARLAASLQSGEPIRSEHINEAITYLTNYSEAAASESPNYDRTNPLTKFLPYQRGSITCFDCDGARNMEHDYLAIAWETVPGVHLDKRMLYVRQAGSLEITADRGHARLAVYTDDFKPEEVVIFDPTPVTKAEDSPVGPPKYARPRPREKREEKSLAELSRAKGHDQAAAEKEKSAEPAPARVPEPEPSRGFPSTFWALPTRRPGNFRAELAGPRRRDYGQYPPATKTPPEQPPHRPGEDTVAVEEPVAVEGPPPPRSVHVPALPRPIVLEPPRVLSPEEEAQILAEARRDYEARVVRNRQRRSALTTTRALSSNLASYAEAGYLSPTDRLAPHNWSRRLVSRIGAYLIGDIGDLAALQSELKNAKIEVPDEITGEADLRKLLSEAVDQFEKSRQQRQVLDEKAAGRKQVNARGRNYSDDLVSRARALIEALRQAPLSPIESEDFRLIHHEIRDRFILDQRRAPSAVNCPVVFESL